MSAKLECIFLGPWWTISWQQIRLKLGNIEKTECLKLWIRIGLVAVWRKELILGINIVAKN